MDPTLQMQGQQQPGQAPDMQTALKNAMMLKAIQGGAMGGAHTPPGGAQMEGQPQMMSPPPVPAVPVSPDSMPGAMPGQQQQPMNPMAMQGQNPVAAALMSQIPGAGGQ